MKKLWNVIKKIIVSAFLILPLILIFVVLSARISGNVPSVFGYSMSIVITPSMSDVLPVGSIILSRDYRQGDVLEEGQIITYAGEQGSFAGKLVTHRIESVTTDDDGNTVIVTKGTMNTAADPEIRPDMVRSVLVCKLVSLGKFYTILQKPTGFLFICVLPLLTVIAYEIYDFKRSLRKEDCSDDGKKEE